MSEQLGATPSERIPSACGGWGDTAAVYRLLSSDRSDWREMLESHGRRTEQGMKPLPMVRCLNDKTELDLNGQRINGLGPLSYEAQSGICLHPTYAVSCDREPLGVLDEWMWAREPRDADDKCAGICESLRWIESYERLAERAAQLPTTRLVQRGDRENDILKLMQRALTLDWPVYVLARSQYNRKLAGAKRLVANIAANPVLGEIEFTIGARVKRPERPSSTRTRTSG